MGVNRAKCFLMTGERVSGEQLFEMGLVNFLVEDSEIFDKALACADHQFAAGPAEAIRASKVASTASRPKAVVYEPRDGIPA
jgi:enoyl-CoA hydratase